MTTVTTVKSDTKHVWGLGREAHFPWRAGFAYSLTGEFEGTFVLEWSLGGTNWTPILTSEIPVAGFHAAEEGGEHSIVAYRWRSRGEGTGHPVTLITDDPDEFDGITKLVKKIEHDEAAEVQKEIEDAKKEGKPAPHRVVHHAAKVVHHKKRAKR